MQSHCAGQYLRQQAYRQEPFQKSSDKASAQAPASPNQILRGAARKCPRHSAYATTTPCARPSTTKIPPPRELIQARDKIPSGPCIIEFPPKLLSQIPPQEKTPLFRHPAGRLAPKRDHTIQHHQIQHQEHTLKGNPKLTRASTHRDVQEATQKFAGEVVHSLGKVPLQLTADAVTGQPPRKPGQVLRRNPSSREPGRKVSQLPLRVTTEDSVKAPAGLAARRPIRTTSNLLSRQSARALTQGNVGGYVGTSTSPLTTPSTDIPLAADQEVTVRVGQQSLSLRNFAGNLVLRVEDTWRLLDEIVSDLIDLTSRRDWADEATIQYIENHR